MSFSHNETWKLKTISVLVYINHLRHPNNNNKKKKPRTRIQWKYTHTETNRVGQVRGLLAYVYLDQTCWCGYSFWCTGQGKKSFTLREVGRGRSVENTEDLTHHPQAVSNRCGRARACVCVCRMCCISRLRLGPTLQRRRSLLFKIKISGEYKRHFYMELVEGGSPVIKDCTYGWSRPSLYLL